MTVAGMPGIREALPDEAAALTAIARLLFHHAVERLAVVAPGAVLEIESDPNAESFYLHMGAKLVGQVSRDWHGVRRTLPQLQFTMTGK